MVENIEFVNKRSRERKKITKFILCFKCIMPDKAIKIKIPFLFEVQDISYSGMKISSKIRLYPDVKMFFRFDMEEHNREIQVEVVWCKHNNDEYLSGVKFLDVTKDDILFFHNIIKKL